MNERVRRGAEESWSCFQPEKEPPCAPAFLALLRRQKQEFISRDETSIRMGARILTVDAHDVVRQNSLDLDPWKKRTVTSRTMRSPRAHRSWMMDGLSRTALEEREQRSSTLRRTCDRKLCRAEGRFASYATTDRVFGSFCDDESEALSITSKYLQVWYQMCTLYRGS